MVLFLPPSRRRPLARNSHVSCVEDRRLRYSPQVATYSRGATDNVCETAVKRLDLALETAASPLVPFPPPGKDATSVAGAAGGVELNGLWAALAHASGSATTVASGALGATNERLAFAGLSDHGACRDRTGDLRLAKAALSQLS